MIPPDKVSAARRALKDAFGVEAADETCRMTRGLSSDVVLRLTVQGSPYLMRVMTRMDEQNDAKRIFACMRAAAEAGLAPGVRYADEADGVVIIDWIEVAPFALDQAARLLPETLRRLHGLPLFPKEFNYVTAHKFFIWRLRAAGLLPAAEAEDVYGAYERICAVCPRVEADIVSSHMDLKPENILFDGRRAWLIDWMAAHRNDRYFDLGIVANFVTDGEEDERKYLERYFGRPANSYETARFFLMRQALHMLSAAVFLILGAKGQPIVAGQTPAFREFHNRIWAGEIDLADDAQKVIYGWVHWQRLLENTRTARLEEALNVVAERDGSAGVPRLLPSPL